MGGLKLIDESRIKVVRLSEERLGLLDGFDCGDEDLNEFIKDDALNYQKGKLAVTYLLLSGARLMGYFCLSNDAVELIGAQKKEFSEAGKNQRTYPAMKIGRLGVCKSDWHTGFGSFMIKQAVGIALLESETAGCRYLTVDAYNRDIPLRFYSNNGFQMLLTKAGKENVPMYMDLKKGLISQG
jgi:GNAT superfamily N-acetyltransferase